MENNGTNTNENTNGLGNLSPEMLERLTKIAVKQERDEALSKIRNDYNSDPVKKMIWDAGFGEKIEKNPEKIGDEVFTNSLLEIYADKVETQMKEKEQAAAIVNEPVIKKEETAPLSQGKTTLNDSEPKMFKPGEESIKSLMETHGFSKEKALFAQAFSKKIAKM